MFCVQSADDFSERSLRLTEVSRDQMNLEEEEEGGAHLEANKGEEGHTCCKSVFLLDKLKTYQITEYTFGVSTFQVKNISELLMSQSSTGFTVNGNSEQVDFIDSSVTEEEEEEIRTTPLTAPPLVPVIHTLTEHLLLYNFKQESY